MSGNLAIFVDAGYLFKQGALAAFGSSLGRHETTLDAKLFVGKLTDWVGLQYPHNEMLRTYWYDGSKDGVPSPEQLEVAALAYVKFRRGRINSSGQQKGVDTLIVRDLMVLSQERSIQRAIVLSGDEDLREGIEYAQDRGVHVAVLGIKAKGTTSQSRELVREADHVLFVPDELIKSALSRTALIEYPTTALPPSGPTPPTPQGTVVPIVVPEYDAVIVAAANCAEVWLAGATREEVAALFAGRPSLPATLDGGLLRYIVKQTGIYTLDDLQRRGARVAFWQKLDELKTGNPLEQGHQD